MGLWLLERPARSTIAEAGTRNERLMRTRHSQYSIVTSTASTGTGSSAGMRSTSGMRRVGPDEE